MCADCLPLCCSRPAPAAELQPSPPLHHHADQHGLLHQQLLRVGVTPEEHLCVCGTTTSKPATKALICNLHTHTEIHTAIHTHTLIQVDRWNHTKTHTYLVASTHYTNRDTHSRGFLKTVRMHKLSQWCR